jgi:hypothetical protein
MFIFNENKIVQRNKRWLSHTHHDNSYFKLEEIWLLLLYYLDWLKKFPNETPPNDFFIMLTRSDSIDVIGVESWNLFYAKIIAFIGESKFNAEKDNSVRLMNSFVTRILEEIASKKLREPNKSEENILKDILIELGLTTLKFPR